MTTEVQPDVFRLYDFLMNQPNDTISQLELVQNGYTDWKENIDKVNERLHIISSTQSNLYYTSVCSVDDTKTTPIDKFKLTSLGVEIVSDFQPMSISNTVKTSSYNPYNSTANSTESLVDGLKFQVAKEAAFAAVTKIGVGALNIGRNTIEKLTRPHLMDIGKTVTIKCKDAGKTEYSTPITATIERIIKIDEGKGIHKLFFIVLKPKEPFVNTTADDQITPIQLKKIILHMIGDNRIICNDCSRLFRGGKRLSRRYKSRRNKNKKGTQKRYKKRI